MLIRPVVLLLLFALAAPLMAEELPYTADQRLPPAELLRQIDALHRDHGWLTETFYRYPDGTAIRAWRTQQRGPALWILAGIHGEEPAGPNAIARSIPQIARLAASGVPMVVIPLANPQAYIRTWRYPNTADRDWQGPVYSVGESEDLLPDLERGNRPRAAKPRGPDTAALTGFALRMTSGYPPQLVLDLHEDELSTEGYVYIQSPVSGVTPVATEVVRLLQVAGMPLRQSGKTRFGEPVKIGLSTRDADGKPFRDGSIDELLSAPTVFLLGHATPGPNGRTVLVIETPAGEEWPLAKRVVAQQAILNRIGDLWRLNEAAP